MRRARGVDDVGRVEGDGRRGGDLLEVVAQLQDDQHVEQDDQQRRHNHAHRRLHHAERLKSKNNSNQAQKFQLLGRNTAIAYMVDFLVAGSQVADTLLATVSHEQDPGVAQEGNEQQNGHLTPGSDQRTTKSEAKTTILCGKEEIVTIVSTNTNPIAGT